MNISKDEVIDEILNLEDLLSQVSNFQITLTKEVRKRFYNNNSMANLSNRHKMLVETVATVLKPSSSAI
jgi:hypothetical protein